jgi:hypothetical protein
MSRETLAKRRPLRTTSSRAENDPEMEQAGVMGLLQNDPGSHVRRNRKILQWFILGPNSQKYPRGKLPAPDLLQVNDIRRGPPIYTST